MNRIDFRFRILGFLSAPAARGARASFPACANFFPCQAGLPDSYVDGGKRSLSVPLRSH